MNKDLKLKRRDLIILLYVAGIVLAALVYFLYFQPKLQENEAAATENFSLLTQYQNLATLSAKQEEYKSKIETDKLEIEQMTQNFPADIKAEDEILYARKLETDLGIAVSDVGVTDPILIYSLASGSPTEDGTASANTASTTSTASSADTTESDAAAAATDSATTVNGTLGGNAASQAASALQNAAGTGASSEDTGVLYSTPVSMTFTSTYDQFKDLLDTVPKNEEKQSIESVSATYDTTTGNLMGTIVINKFLMTGTNQVYTTPDDTAVPKGTQNIFGTVTAPAEQTAQAAESTGS